MKVLKATFEQMKEINNSLFGNDKIQFVIDSGNNFIVGKNVLDCCEFSSIKHILEELEEIDYSPVIEVE